MTPEQRLDRLERIVKLAAKVDLRHRRRMREMDEKINILIDAQIKNEERFAQTEKRFARTEEMFARTDERFARTDRAIAQLVAAQGRTDQRLDILIDIVRKKELGESTA